MLTGMPRSTGVGTRTLPEQIADVLTGEIFDGQLAPGSRIAEQGVADRFGVSRGPVREALAILERNGLVINRPRVSARVRHVSAAAQAELLEIRTALLCVGVRFAAVKAEAADIERLNTLLEQLSDDGDAEAGLTVGEFYRNEYLLYDAMLRVARSRDLSSLLRQITGGGVLHVRLLGDGDERLFAARLRGRKQLWRALFDAIAAGDAAAAEQRTRELVAPVHRALIDAMAAREAGSSGGQRSSTP